MSEPFEEAYVTADEQVELGGRVSDEENTATATPLDAQDTYRVLEYVSRGRGFVGVEPYPDAAARKAIPEFERILADRDSLTSQLAEAKQEAIDWANIADKEHAQLAEVTKERDGVVDGLADAVDKLNAQQAIIDSLRTRLGAHHVGDLTDGGHCKMCDAALTSEKEGAPTPVAGSPDAAITGVEP